MSTVYDQLVRIFLLSILWNTHLDASLTPTSIENVCPGDRVNLTCTVNMDALQWLLPNPTTGGSSLDVTFLDSDTSMIGLHNPLAGDSEGIYTIILDGIDMNPTRLTSTLEVTLLQSLAGRVIECTGSMVTIQFYDPPSPPQSLTIIQSINNTDNSMVTIQWDSPQASGAAAVDNYTVSVTPMPLSGDPILTVRMDTMIELILNYNVQYTVSVMATNCAGSSDPSLNFGFILVKCMVISPPSNGVLGPINNRAEGVTVTFQCNDGFIPTGDMTTTCMADMTWNLDPGSFVCSPMLTLRPPVDCGVPDPPVNGSFLGSIEDTSEDSMIFYRCDDGLFPMGNLSSTCDSNGMWNPNPRDQSCTTEQFGCSQPAPPASGFVLRTSNLTILFGCNEGYTPFRNMTANCIAMNLWSFVPAEHQCKKAVTGTSSILDTGSIVGITIVITLIVSVLIGLAIGMLLMYFIMKPRINKINERQASPPQQRTPPPLQQQTPPPPLQQQTTPAGPVYEEVSQPKEEIELKTNQAYGPVSRL